MRKHTPGPWRVRKQERNGEILDCFVCADDVNGFAYEAEILGDDEYSHSENDIERKLADCAVVAASLELLEALEELCDFLGDCEKTAKGRAAIHKATDVAGLSESNGAS